MQILKFEFIKIIRNKSFIGAGIALLLSIIAILFIGFFNSQLTGVKGHTSLYGHTAIERNIKFANNYEGTLTDNKIKNIIEDYLPIYQKKRKEKQQIFDYFQWTVIDTFTIPEQQDIYTEMIEAVNNDEEYTIDKVNLLSMKDVGFKDYNFPIKIGNFMTWTDLLKVTASSFVPIALFVILFCSILFANDTAKNINPLLLSTKYGRSKMVKSKILVGTTLTITSFLFIQLIILLIFGLYYGFSGWDTSIQANLDWKIFDFPIRWNVLNVYVFGLAFHLVGLIFISGITMLISSLANSPFSALAISLGIFFIPQALTHIFLKGIPNKILYIFPINTFQINKVLLWMSRDNMFFFKTFQMNIVLILLILIVIKLLTDIFIYHRMNNLKVS